MRATRIGFVFQQFFLAEHATALENVADGLLYAGVPVAERRLAAAEVLAAVGLGDRLKARPNQLSGGERQRVAIARALVGRPAIVLADEPTGNLDSATGIAILALLEQLHDDGATIAVITHDRDLAGRLPRQVEMLDGRIVSDTATRAEHGRTTSSAASADATGEPAVTDRDRGRRTRPEGAIVMTRRGFRSKDRHRLRLLLALGLCAAAATLSGSVAQAVSAATPPADTTACPTYNAPNALTLAGGTPQSAKLGTPFADPLQVTLANTNGCPITTPLAGIAVTFAAPGSGPSGTFSASGSNAVLVGTNAAGSATASQFTANTLAGGYQVVASSDYGSVSFSLVNTASGVPATIAPALVGEPIGLRLDPLRPTAPGAGARRQRQPGARAPT